MESTRVILPCAKKKRKTRTVAEVFVTRLASPSGGLPRRSANEALKSGLCEVDSYVAAATSCPASDESTASEVLAVSPRDRDTAIVSRTAGLRSPSGFTAMEAPVALQQPRRPCGRVPSLGRRNRLRGIANAQCPQPHWSITPVLVFVGREHAPTSALESDGGPRRGMIVANPSALRISDERGITGVLTWGNCGSSVAPPSGRVHVPQALRPALYAHVPALSSFRPCEEVGDVADHRPHGKKYSSISAGSDRWQMTFLVAAPGFRAAAMLHRS